MLRRLQRLFGDGGPPIELLGKVTRLGVAQKMPNGAAKRGSVSDRFLQEAAAGLGRGKQWRENQLPAKTLKRLEEENELDAALYEAAVQQAVALGGANS